MAHAHSARPVAGTLAVVAALLVALTLPASAQGPPLSGSGSAIVTDFDIPEPGEPGGRVDLGNSDNWRQTRTLEGHTVGEGPLDGEFRQVVTGIVRDRTNVVTFHGTMTFTGTVEGCAGVHALTLAITGRGHANPPVTEAKVQIIGPSDIRGGGTVSQVVDQLTYDIRYVCP